MKSVFQLRFLGPVQIEQDGEPVRGFESRKALALLAYLAVERQPVPRERLVDLFWEDKTEAQGRNNLNWVLNRLSTHLPGCLQTDRHTVQFLGESVECSYQLDLDAFEELETSGEPTSLAAAVESYRGEFLEGLVLRGCPEFELWQVREQERWRRRVTSVLNQLVAHHGQQAEVEQGLRFARRLLELEPWREEAHRGVMRLLALDGQRSAALAQYETCRRLLAEELGVEPSEATELLYTQIQTGELAPPALVPGPGLPPQPPAPGEPPFKGLEFFDVADAELFFGRETLTARLVQRLSSAESEGRFLAVVGTSGSGKSSLVRAGLVAALQHDVPLADDTPLPESSHRWPAVIITPTANPLESLAAGLTQDVESVTATATLMDDLAQDARSLYLYARKLLSPNRSGRRLLLVVDQFEELFTQCRDLAQRRAFIDNLLTAAGVSSFEEREGSDDGPTVVVITLRADFYHHCAQFEDLRLALENDQVYIGPMTPQELRRAIEEPARAGGWDLEPGLVDLLLRDVGEEPGALPLLSHALLETWKRRQGHTLTLDGYTEAGGVHGAIARTAETVYQGLDEHQQAIARNIFLRLSELGEGSGDVGTSLYTRRRAALDELFPHPEEAGAVEAVLHTLADARLITTERETVQVAHEALIREWPTLREWLEESRVDVRMQRSLAAAVAEWERAGREPSYLLRGARLAQFEGWAEVSTLALAQNERAYLEISIAERETQQVEEEARRQRELETAQKLAQTEKQRAEEQTRTAGRLRRWAVFLTGALIVAGASAILAVLFNQRATQNANIALQQRDEAQQQANLATSRELAAAALDNLEADPERSVLLALQALSTAHTLEAENALHQTVPALRLLRTFRRSDFRSDYIIAISPDGKHLATTSPAGLVKIWDAMTGQELLTLSGHYEWVNDVAFSLDGTRLATGSDDGAARIWDAGSGQKLLVLYGHRAWVYRVAFSPDGTRLATASLDGMAKVWDVASGEELLTLSGHADVPAASWPYIDGGVLDVVFSPDGTRLATADTAGMVRVWDSTSGQELFALSGHINEVNEVAFSPDGTLLATAGLMYVKIWDLSTDPARGQQSLVISRGDGGFASVAFSPDGARLATGGYNGVARVWDTTSGRELLSVSGHKRVIDEVVFSSDGTRLVTNGEGEGAKVWDVSPGRELLTLISQDNFVRSIAFSPDGSRLVAVEGDGTIQVHNAATGEKLLTLTGDDSVIYRTAFSPDGTRFAMASADGTAKVWDSVSGEELFALSGHQVQVWSVAFDPDGTRLATGDRNGGVRMWDAVTGQELWARWWTHTDLVLGLAFSPDGMRLATGSWDGRVIMWDAISGRSLFSTFPNSDYLSGHVFDVAFSPDGEYLVASRRDGTVALWRIASQELQPLATLTGHDGMVISIAFSPDGTRLASAGMDGTIKVWDVEASVAAASGQELLILSAGTGGMLDLAYSPDGTRLATCSTDGTVRVYVLDLEELKALARERLTRSLTDEECRQYLHTDECPALPWIPSSTN